MTRLGIDEAEVTDSLREGQALAMAVSAAVQDEPTVALAIAHYLADQGEADLAQAFTAVSDRASARHIGQLVQSTKRKEIA